MLREPGGNKLLDVKVRPKIQYPMRKSAGWPDLTPFRRNLSQRAPFEESRCESPKRKSPEAWKREQRRHAGVPFLLRFDRWHFFDRGIDRPWISADHRDYRSTSMGP